MSAPFAKGDFVTFLAPMQDISDVGFMNIVASCGAPDFFAAEYFRIHEYFNFDEFVLEAVRSRPAGSRVVAQFIGCDEFYIARAAERLRAYPEVEMLDLNLGCPAPKIYKKNAGGGLLRDPKKVESILKTMRSAWDRCLSVKMRLGFESDEEFPDLFKLVCDCGADFVTVHGRTVKQLYRGRADYAKIARAAASADIPVIVNGDVDCAETAAEIRAETACSGVMSGRGAVRNPWIFRQIREKLAGLPVFAPTLLDVRWYVEMLCENIKRYSPRIKHADSRLKKFLNFIAVGVDENGEFLAQMRRAEGIDALLRVCDAHLAGKNSAEKFNCAGYQNLCARPNCEQ